jgi:hypothetical protein
MRLGGLPERPMGADCKSVGVAFDGSNPSPATETPTSVGVFVLWHRGEKDERTENTQMYD